MAAAPAAGTAFGTSALAASAPVYASMAAPLSGAMFTGSFVPSVLTSSTGISMGGGGLLSGVTLEAAKPYLYGASIMGQAYSQMSQARFTKSMYEVEQLRVAADTESKRLNAELDSVARLRKLKANIAARLTTQYSGGVAGLDSTRILETTAMKEYGKDYKLALLNIENQVLSGNVQSDIYDASATQATNNGLLNSAVLLGTAAYQYKQLGGAPEA